MATASTALKPSIPSRILPPSHSRRGYPIREGFVPRILSSDWGDFPRLRHQIRDYQFLGPFCPRLGSSASIVPSNSTGEILTAGELNNAQITDDCTYGKQGIESREAEREVLDDQQMVRICDKLIGVFMVDKPKVADWRRLLAFSKEWSNIRDHFYRRCQERAIVEDDPGMKQAFLRLGRKLREIDDDVQRHNELLEAIKREPFNISGLVTRRRKYFTSEFFEHIHTVAESYYDIPSEQKVLVELCNACLAAVQAYDSASESIEALNAAELKFEDIINSPTLDVACRKIDSLAEKKQLDSALMLMLTKAWSAAKDSNMMKDEVKDILLHLYMTAASNLQSLVPKETRMLKHLLTIEDPEEQMSALIDAFTPGAEDLEVKTSDSMYTTPHELFTWIQTVVDAYHFSRQGTLIMEARDLMNPKVIQRLEELKKIIQEKFM